MSARRAWPRRAWSAIVGTAVVALVLGVALPGRAFGADVVVPEPRGYVTDDAHVIGEPRTAQLEGYLVSLREKTGVQFAVLTVDSTAPDDPQAYKSRVMQAWKLGDRAHTDVLLMVVAMRERRVVFETGYGLEGTLPDGWQARMLRELVVPKFRAGEYADGVTLGVLASADRIAREKGVSVPWTGDAIRYTRPPRGERGVPPIVLAFVIFMLVIMMIAATQSRRRGYIGGPWSGGGYGGWGGGFGGGGGGGGFGGFGGGGGGFSSGGGGGGAGW